MNEILLRDIVDEVRRLAQQGAPIVDLLRHVQRRVGKTHATFESIRVLREVFTVPLFDLTSIGAWEGFDSGNPGLSDEEIESTYGEKLRNSVRTKGG
jgi:hypothetical protein